METTWRDATVASLVALAALPALALGGLAAPAAARHVAVLIDPAGGLPAAAALADQVDARVLDAGALPGLWVLSATEPGLADRLRTAGAWAVLDPRAAGCAANRAAAPASSPTHSKVAT